MKRLSLIALLLFITTSYVVPQEEPHPNCCLCMCHAKDETKCSRMCIRLQHGKKIVELPQMKVCTRECKRVHVKQLPPDDTVHLLN